MDGRRSWISGVVVDGSGHGGSYARGFNYLVQHSRQAANTWQEFPPPGLGITLHTHVISFPTGLFERRVTAYRKCCRMGGGHQTSSLGITWAREEKLVDR